ncbi:ImmA/IrrE family metallo-endopeptidase [Pseudonocardia alni]|uniref:ImmA/IrrE family metallo-endopeptidase n=1 Tax=Pseudonocardia alni TaxID=33907 RepID=UPI00280B08BF|nr:ImmA/IrrE family metallo-endopeptidase [Pseudonocardia alni]
MLTERRDELAIHRLCVELLDSLRLASPFTAWDLTAALAARRGRPIRITSADLGGVAVVGHLVAQPGRDRILHDSRATKPQQEAVIYHELGHLILGHLEPGDVPLACGSVDTLRVAHADATEISVAAWREWEAETAATQLARIAAVHPRPDEYQLTERWNPERGIAAALGLVRPRRRQV